MGLGTFLSPFRELARFHLPAAENRVRPTCSLGSALRVEDCSTWNSGAML